MLIKSRKYFMRANIWEWSKLLQDFYSSNQAHTQCSIEIYEDAYQGIAPFLAYKIYSWPIMTTCIKPAFFISATFSNRMVTNTFVKPHQSFNRWQSWLKKGIKDNIESIFFTIASTMEQKHFDKMFTIIGIRKWTFIWWHLVMKILIYIEMGLIFLTPVKLYIYGSLR